MRPNVRIDIVVQKTQIIRHVSPNVSRNIPNGMIYHCRSFVVPLYNLNWQLEIPFDIIKGKSHTYRKLWSGLKLGYTLSYSY